MPWQNEFNLRSFTQSDSEAVVQTLNSAFMHSMGIRQAVVDAVGNVRLNRYVPINSKKIVVTNQQDEIVGYAYLANKEENIVYELGGAVHPDYWGQGIGTKLIYWAEKQAQSLSSYVPNGIKTVLQVNLFSIQYEVIELFTQSAYSKVREWMHLVIDLEKPPILPPLDKDYHIREMNLEDDWEIVAPAMDEAYADHWGILSLPQDYSTDSEEQAHDFEELPEDESYSNAQGFCFIVMDNDTVAGGILCNAKIPERNDTGRVGSLFVRPQYRRQGVGRALMLQAFDAFWQAGIHRIVNDTDSESFTEAPAFYTSLGMREYRREYLYEKTIRDGKEMRRLSV